VYDEKQLALMEAAIRAVARDGLEKTTTRSIGAAAGINDAYIYRYFRDKEDLLSQAFTQVNDRMIELVLREIDRQKRSTPDDACLRFTRVVRVLWDALMDEPETCLFCEYYYHSASYKKYASEAHRALGRRLWNKVGERYDLNGHAEHAFYYLMESIFGFAVKAIERQTLQEEAAFAQMCSRLYEIFRSAATPKACAE